MLLPMFCLFHPYNMFSKIIETNCCLEFHIYIFDRREQHVAIFRKNPKTVFGKNRELIRTM